MTRTTRIGPRLFALFVLGCLLLNFPLLYVFERDVTLGGVPLLFAYVFLAWGLLIALVALAIGRGTRVDDEPR